MHSNDWLLGTELVIIISVIIVQLFHTFKAYLKIRQLSHVFARFLFVRNGWVDRKFLKDPDNLQKNIVYTSGEDAGFHRDNNFAAIVLTETEGNNETILRIRNAINAYLLNNHGAAVNFSIIRDIIDRETEARDEEITSSIPTPLYLGLAATMIGIIFGLLAMPDIDGSNFTEGINRLIDGVKLAMTASLTGLLCTTLLSSFLYKKGRKQMLLLKNAQLSHLQAKLLPELVRAEESGVTGLKASLDRFSREAATITGHVYQSAIETGNNLRVQESIIEKLEKLNVTKVSRANLEMFSRLENNMEAFHHFSTYLAGMEEIAAHLKDFATRTAQIDKIAGQISTSLSESRELVKFLTAHFEKIEHAGSAALKAVDLSDSHFRESVELLKERTHSGIEKLFSLSDKTETDLRETFETLNARISEATGKHIDEFTSAYEQAVPRFKELALLEPIRETLASKSDLLISQTAKANQEILNALHELTQTIRGGSDQAASAELREAVRELTRQMNMENQGNTFRGKSWIKKAEPILRVSSWIGIIAVSLLIILHYFKVI